jgi:hypothetical protein
MHILIVMHNGLIFWGDASHCAIIFEIQNNIIRIITGYKTRASCRDFFKTLKILPLHSQYTLSLLLCAINNKNITSANLNQIYYYIKKGVYSTGTKVFNCLPQSIQNISGNPKQFKSTLKNYLYAHSYSIDEYFNVNK